MLFQIHQFKQEPNDFVRDCASRLQQYLMRCPVMEISSQERLVSLFLEGLRSKELHSTIYMKYLTNLDQCIHKAIEYNDNCAKGVSSTGSQTNESTSRVLSQANEIIQGVTKKMQQLCVPLRVTERRVKRPYICGICGKNHPTGQCTPKNQWMVRQEPQQTSWCNFHKRWGNHSTKNCFNRIQHL